VGVLRTVSFLTGDQTGVFGLLELASRRLFYEQLMPD